MLKLEMKMGHFKVDKNKFTKDLEKTVEDAFRFGAKVFSEEAVKNVHIDTGMSRSTFLGRVTRFSGASATAEKYLDLSDSITSIPVTGYAKIKRSRRSGQFSRQRRYLNTNEIKGPAAGRKRGFHHFVKRGNTYTYIFKANVYQYDIHEPQPSAMNSYTQFWASFPRGANAFRNAVFYDILKNAPKIKDYVIKDSTI